MGLDQYAYAVPCATTNTEFYFDSDNNGVTLIAQWRKHADLQGWMENVWVTKRTLAGDPPEPETEGFYAGEVVFNCNPVRLTLTDLEQLETAVNREQLPETTGFFFGHSRPDEKGKDLEFIAEARAFMDDGYDIYYTSWW